MLPFSDPIADWLMLRAARELAAVQGHADCAQAIDERRTMEVVDGLAAKLDQRREHVEPADAPKPVIRTPKG